MERVRGEVLALPQRERMLPAVMRGRPGDEPPGGVKGDVGSQPSDNSKATRFISGARVCAQEPPSDADLIRIIRPKVSVSQFALVRNRFKGRDGYERLCVQFISTNS